MKKEFTNYRNCSRRWTPNIKRNNTHKLKLNFLQLLYPMNIKGYTNHNVNHSKQKVPQRIKVDLTVKDPYLNYQNEIKKLQTS